MKISVFGKTTENIRKHKKNKLVTTKKRRNYFVSEPNKKMVFRNFICNRNEKNKIKNE